MSVRTNEKLQHEMTDSGSARILLDVRVQPSGMVHINGNPTHSPAQAIKTLAEIISHMEGDVARGR